MTHYKLNVCKTPFSVIWLLTLHLPPHPTTTTNIHPAVYYQLDVSSATLALHFAHERWMTLVWRNVVVLAKPELKATEGLLDGKKVTDMLILKYIVQALHCCFQWIVYWAWHSNCHIQQFTNNKQVGKAWRHRVDPKVEYSTPIHWKLLLHSLFVNREVGKAKVRGPRVSARGRVGLEREWGWVRSRSREDGSSHISHQGKDIAVYYSILQRKTKIRDSTPQCSSPLTLGLNFTSNTAWALFVMQVEKRLSASAGPGAVNATVR